MNVFMAGQKRRGLAGSHARMMQVFGARTFSNFMVAREVMAA